MIRIVIIKTDKGSVLYRLMSVVFETKEFECIRKDEISQVLLNSDPDFVLTDIKPVNGNDLMSMVSELDELSRLRVFFINLFTLKWKIKFPSLNLKNNFLSFLFETRTIKKIH